MDAYDLVVRHEGERNLMYKDILGIESIGVGHNLRSKPISNAAVRQIFKDDMADVINAVKHKYPWWNRLNEVRQAVVIDMVFNMGLEGFNKFKNTINHIAGGTYSAAALEMLDSEAARELPGRYSELASMMRTGEWPLV